MGKRTAKPKSNRKKIKLTIEATCMSDPDGQHGEMHFTFADTTIRVMDGKREIGNIAGAIGGGMELCDNRIPDRQGCFYVHGEAIWKAFQAALKKAV